MAKRDVKITCTAIFTEGCEKRLTEALVDIYYSRKKHMSDTGESEILEKAASE